ncbi:hypothetical protein A1O3_07033 [Capronia epimyces CBS 606.96]|uniref:Uncharacterized protein n=1 Tax=Capronia epimyces CBS 606.96 TaxID=1182542 RepID=W9YEL7_9EURO|nr:uncharacterized protein A1O3_07033 [Capronia epimyces CBS 606.96]EXJ80749.1 hypothetical protein A1O3_07033 [Capronia epimyces CBS 606.96]
MNVFRKKAKAKDDAYIIPPALPSDPTSLAKMSRSLKRKQKSVPEPKPEIDLTTALPDTNDFRTSLLMPGLSARFSMLREQDDPSTLVGKASDDSVLFPKRASRLNLFSHNPLTDIAEVSSIHTTIRAPFAEAERSHSFTEGAGYASDDAGSVVARSRATEGNNLFGGRQKMYRIGNASSSRDLIEGAAPVATSRHLYQDDVARPTYPDVAFKGREDPERGEYQERPISVATEEHEQSSVVNTPSTGFSKSRGTASSTASGPSNRRTSTAATSVISDSPVPRQSNASSGSNSRMRASDFGSEGSVLRHTSSSDSRKPGHVSETQDQPPLPASPITKRQISLSRSATNLSEKHVAGESPFSTRGPREASPPPARQRHILAPLDMGLSATKSQLRRYQTASPTYHNEDSDVYHQSLEPNDRGKATAMGLFNRPRQQFDEQKFEERQLQMHEGKTAPSANNNLGNRGTSEQSHETAQMTASVPSSPLHSSFHSSNVNRSRAQSSASSVNPAQVHAKVEALIKRQNQEYTALRAPKSEPTSSTAPLPKPTNLASQHAASRGTFLDTFDGSDDDGDELDSPMLGRYEPPPRLVPLDVHPALRDGSQTFDFGGQVTVGPQITRPHSNASVDTSPSAVHDTPDTTTDSLHRSSDTKASGSPTIEPTTGLGLSGLIHTHLRHDSDRSSLLPPPSPAPRKQPSGFPGFREREPSVASTARTINPPESTHSDPWEFDTTHRPPRSPFDPPINDPTLVMSQKAQQILGQAISHRSHAADKAQPTRGSDPSPSDEHVPSQPWQNNAMSSHQRGESTETQKEFGNELAERARKIQEGLKGVAEAEKRSRSPIPGYDRQNPAAQALQVLRHKASKASLTPRINESQPKAMKMLGLAGVSKLEMGGQSPNVGARGNFAFEHGYDDYHPSLTPREHAGDFGSPSGRQTPGFGRPAPYANRPQADFDRSRQRSATPTSGRGPRQERNEPAPGERSRSRAGRHREEQPFAATDRGRRGPPPAREQQRSHVLPQGPASQHSPRVPYAAQRGPPPVDPRNYERSASAMSNRRPSGTTRPEPSGYFDGRAVTPAMAGTPQLANGQTQPTVNLPRPSPRPPFPHSPMSPFGQPGLSPALSGPPSAAQSALPSPVGPLPAPPNNGRSTPVEGRSTPAGARKKSVTKGMISEPTFISSTSSIPLVGLPRGPRPSQIASPPIPAMNPRRRGNTMSERPDAHKSLHVTQSPTVLMPESQDQRALVDQQQQKPAPRQRNRLRKTSSEGGSMAARARQQAMMSEFGHERLRSPALPVFPNRSATSLGVHQDGGMF